MIQTLRVSLIFHSTSTTIVLKLVWVQQPEPVPEILYPALLPLPPQIPLQLHAFNSTSSLKPELQNKNPSLQTFMQAE